MNKLLLAITLLISFNATAEVRQPTIEEGCYETAHIYATQRECIIDRTESQAALQAEYEQRIKLAKLAKAHCIADDKEAYIVDRYQKYGYYSETISPERMTVIRAECHNLHMDSSYF